MSQDGLIPIDNDIIIGGRIHHRKHVVHGKGTALPKLMQNLKLFDQSVMVKKGAGFMKPNYQTQEIKKKPIKFII